VSRVEVDDRGHPRIAAPPHRCRPSGLIRLGQQPAHRPGAGLVDADPGGRLGLPETLRRGGHEEAVHGAPGDAVLGRDLRHGPVRPSHRRGDSLAEPSGQPGAERQLVGRLGERAPRARGLDAPVAALPHPQPQRHAPVRHVLHPANRPLVHDTGEHPAVRTGRLLGHRLDQHPAPAVGLQRHVQHPIVGQGEQQRRSVFHSSWPLQLSV